MKKYILLIGIFLTLNSYLFSQTATAPNGDGSSGNPYQIASLENLYWVATNSNVWNDNAYFLQTADIDASGTSSWFSNGAGGYFGWYPIGSDTVTKFNGYYDGNNHTISGLYINRPAAVNVGLFGHVGHVSSVTEANTIENLGLINTTIIGGRGTGALIGRITGNANTLIQYVYVVDGDVTGNGATGGVIGSFNSYRETPGGTDNPIFQNSYSNNSVTYSGLGAGDKFGGLAGCSQKGTIKNSYARGTITVDGGQRIGGLAGCIDYRGELVNSYSTGLVSAPNSTLVGGFIGNTAGAGSNDGVVANSFWDTETSGQATSAAEGVGEAEGKTTAEMKTEATFLGAGWDMTNIWDVNISNNNGYPLLYGNNNNYLPVELSDFIVSDYSSEGIKLYWKTASEVNNENFLIQRSVDGKQFTTIGKIAGHGNSSYIHTYLFVDKEVSPHTIYYYRLQQVDYNGDFSYSSVVSAFFSHKESIITEFVHGGIFLSAFDEEIEHVSMYNAFGQRLFNRNCSYTNQVFVPISKNGIYVLIVKSKSSYLQKKLIIN